MDRETETMLQYGSESWMNRISRVNLGGGKTREYTRAARGSRLNEEEERRRKRRRKKAQWCSCVQRHWGRQEKRGIKNILANRGISIPSSSQCNRFILHTCVHTAAHWTRLLPTESRFFKRETISFPLAARSKRASRVPTQLPITGREGGRGRGDIFQRYIYVSYREQRANCFC